MPAARAESMLGRTPRRFRAGARGLYTRATMTKKTIRAASVQFQHRAGDKAFNLGRIREFVGRAAARGVELIAFPEMCVTGYWHVRNLARESVEELAEEFPSGPSTRALLSLSAEHSMTIGAGLVERDSEGSLFNSYVVAMPDGRVERHRKLHAF